IDSSGYTVVARRYRPRSFAELVGQDHISHALDAAIAMGRVGHAYLFTGARGVGKTSSARIFAKALNASDGVEQELAADMSRSIDSGDDMDVIEIDGASNRGIEEIRTLRANVNVRPSRARYKIYIIDEVHMLTNQAFNALLKTLEEPPPHVKFIFCTTDPDKLPITVLSRCQRFDFVPIKLDAIRARLSEICSAEGFEADDDALSLLARRAAGSMRDSQSLLEQVMSFSQERISVEQVQQLLGIADEGRLLALAHSLAAHDALRAMELVDEAARSGADAGQLAEQLLNYFRDVMAVGVGGGPEMLKLANPVGHAGLKELAAGWGVQSILASIQILDESLVRMRTSVSAQALLEVALVQICQLSQLASIPALLEAMRAGGGGAAAPQATKQAPASQVAPKQSSSEKKNNERIGEVSSQPSAIAPSLLPSPVNSPPTSPSPSSARAPAVVSTAAPDSSSGAAAVSQAGEQGSLEALQQWKKAASSINDMLADYAGLAVSVIPNGADHWKVVFPPGAVRPREVCEQADRRHALEQAVSQVLQRTIRLTFAVMPGEPARTVAAAQPSTNRVQKMREVSENPYVRKCCEALDGEIIRVDAPATTSASKSSDRAAKQSV
ncbi:MAG: DNA polymerase III subunit gamma/tau, partial [Aureliella sp.]